MKPHDKEPIGQEEFKGTKRHYKKMGRHGAVHHLRPRKRGMVRR